MVQMNRCTTKVKIFQLPESQGCLHPKSVTYNPSTTIPSDIRNAISRLGYDGDAIKADPKAYEKLPVCCKKKTEGQ